MAKFSFKSPKSANFSLKTFIFSKFSAPSAPKMWSFRFLRDLKFGAKKIWKSKFCYKTTLYIMISNSLDILPIEGQCLNLRVFFTPCKNFPDPALILRTDHQQWRRKLSQSIFKKFPIDFSTQYFFKVRKLGQPL